MDTECADHGVQHPSLSPLRPTTDLCWSDGMSLRFRHSDWVLVALPGTPMRRKCPPAHDLRHVTHPLILILGGAGFRWSPRWGVMPAGPRAYLCMGTPNDTPSASDCHARRPGQLDQTEANELAALGVHGDGTRRWVWPGTLVINPRNLNTSTRCAECDAAGEHSVAAICSYKRHSEYAASLRVTQIHCTGVTDHAQGGAGDGTDETHHLYDLPDPLGGFDGEPNRCGCNTCGGIQ